MTQTVTAQIGYAAALPDRSTLQGYNPQLQNLVVEPHAMTIRDMRALPNGDFSLDDAGFTFAHHDAPEVVSDAVWEDNRVPGSAPLSPASVAYLEETARFVRDLTGAREAFAVESGGVVSRISKRTKRSDSALPTAHLAHLDFTPGYAANSLRWALGGRTPAPYSRFAVYQTWRPFSRGPQDNTLTLCDGRTVDPDKLFVYYSVFGPEEDERFVAPSRAGFHDPAHRWYYLSDMTPADVLIFKGFDSADADGASINALHTAFDNPLAGDDADPRRSVETRIVALFD